jgi:hypothetical protein
MVFFILNVSFSMMKSSSGQLSARGFLIKGAEQEYVAWPLPEKIRLLQSGIAMERTLGARLLSSAQGAGVVAGLMEALQKEKKLYAKIEICNALIAHGAEAVGPLIEQLGKIGANQHRVIPQERFHKESYPLPRDIAARTLGQMGVAALPDLLVFLTTAEHIWQLSEAIDAVGYSCFYHCRYREDALEKLHACFIAHTESDLIRWKIYRSMSAFPSSKPFLMSRYEIEEQLPVRHEIERSLRIIGG